MLNYFIIPHRVGTLESMDIVCIIEPKAKSENDEAILPGHPPFLHQLEGTILQVCLAAGQEGNCVKGKTVAKANSCSIFPFSSNYYKDQEGA